MHTGGKTIVDLLARAGIRHVFTVPGESFLDILDAMHGRGDISPVTTRNEAAAAMMAEATGKLSGEIGVALVTRGPGVANAVAGVYVAGQDCSPMMLLAGLPALGKTGIPRFQDIELAALFSGLARYCAIVPSPETIEYHFDRAYRAAHSGCRGPVVLGLPENVLAAPAPEPTWSVPNGASRPPSEADLKRLTAFLAHAERPLVITGAARWSREAAQLLARFCARNDLPVATSFRRQDRIDNRHACYAGNLGLRADEQLRRGVRAADLVIAFGACLDAVTTDGYSLIETPHPRQQLIVIAPEDELRGTPLRPAHHIDAGAAEAAVLLGAKDAPAAARPWRVWRTDLRAAHVATLREPATKGGVLAEIVAYLASVLPEDAIVTNGAGNYAATLHRMFTHVGFPTQLAPLSGSMGYGVPAAIAAKLAHPDRTVIAFAGDGCFQMTGADLATAVQYGVAIVTIVVNNGSLGTIRMHQERRFPNRIVATSLVNPDFAALARAHGAFGETVTTTSGFVGAFARALASGTPAVIELRTETEAQDDVHRERQPQRPTDI